jgi:phage baseplate assembly protein gpV
VSNPTVYGDGTIIWYDDDTKRHRIDGPAVTFINGCEQWYIHGHRHRIGGPAVVFRPGDQDWYIDGILHFTNKSYQTAANLTDEEMTLVVLKYGNVS